MRNFVKPERILCIICYTYASYDTFVTGHCLYSYAVLISGINFLRFYEFIGVGFCQSNDSIVSMLPYIVIYARHIFPPVEAPDAPDKPRVADAARDFIDIEWKAPFNGGSPITGYIVERLDCSKPNADWQPLTRTPDRKSTRLNSSHVRTPRMPSSA